MTGTPEPEELWREPPLWREFFYSRHVLPLSFTYDLRSLIGVTFNTLASVKRVQAQGEEALTLLARAEELLHELYLFVNELAELLPMSDLHTSPVEVRQTLDRVLRVTRAERERTCRLELDIPPGLPQVPGPRGWLNRVFSGLLIDALAAMRFRAPQQHVLGIRVRQLEGSVRVAISATGPGLAPEVIPHLFQPRCPPPVPGSGRWMGLFGLQAVARDMGGEIRVENQPGRGVTFDVLLPVGEQVQRIPTPIPQDEPSLRALHDNERNAIRALLACFALELVARLGPLTTLLKRLSGLQERQGMARKLLVMCLEDSRRLRDDARELRHLRYTQPEPPLPVDVDGCLREALRITRDELTSKARLEEDYAPGLPHVLGSPGHLLRVFLLLVRGCLLAMKQDPPSQPVLRVRTWREDSWVRVTLLNTGDPLRPDELPSIIDDGDGSNPYGLPICHAIVQAMGGELRVDSLEGGGTTWSVHLPVATQP